jgi:hypothetical protein
MTCCRFSSLKTLLTLQVLIVGGNLRYGEGRFRRRVKMQKPYRIFALLLLGILAVASVISDIRPRANAHAPLLEGALVPPDVRSAIDRACRDCHSETTRYPWYSYIAPVSWLVNRDIQSGREHLNLSRWSEYSVIRRERTGACRSRSIQ